MCCVFSLYIDPLLYVRHICVTQTLFLIPITLLPSIWLFAMIAIAFGFFKSLWLVVFDSILYLYVKLLARFRSYVYTCMFGRGFSKTTDMKKPRFILYRRCVIPRSFQKPRVLGFYAFHKEILFIMQGCKVVVIFMLANCVFVVLIFIV